MFSYLSPIPEVDSPPQDPMELDYASVAESTAVGDSDSSQEDEMVVPHREPSPAPSIAPSVYGFTQEMVDEIMESKYGRKVNIMCRTYSVAADDSELEVSLIAFVAPAISILPKFPPFFPLHHS
ncbi:hypothetical protein FRC03_008204 [Tulasnella sp. 419]|nr:hypothetical protein FRC03_008204 [Tulasnella sp. 419]